MELTLDLPLDTDRRLREQASRLGVAAADYARRIIEDHLPTAAAAPDEATLSLLAAWDKEDATDDPAELERRRREWEQFRESVNEHHPSDRVVYP